RMWSRDHTMIDETYAWFERHGMPADVDEGMRKSWLEIGRAVDEVEEITAAGDGEELDLGGRRARLKWTPGHTDYHAVLVDEPERILFSGDHVLPRITSNVGLYPYSRDDPLGDFLDALRSVRSLPVTRVLPAHGEHRDEEIERVRVRQAATLEFLRDLRRRPCADCGQNFSPWVMDFDHRDPRTKSFSLAAGHALLKSREVLLAEIAKCDIVCAN